MKRLMTFMLGLAMLTTTVVALLAQKSDSTGKKAKNKQKKPKPSTDTKKP